MNDAWMSWLAAAGVLATLAAVAVVALRRSRQEAERRRHAEAAALELARQEAGRAAAQRAAAQKAAAEVEARRRAEAEARRRAEAAARHERERVAAEQAAEAEARAAVQAAYLEGERLAAEQAEQAAQRAAEWAAAGEATRAPTPPPPRPRSAEPPLVMVADDSKVVRVKTSRLLAQHGYRVVLAEDGAQAAQLIEQDVPLVLITDVEMPRMDGFELTRHVRRHALARHIPIVMITSADDRLKAEAAAAGVTLVLGKPYAEDQLLACIAQALTEEGVQA